MWARLVFFACFYECVALATGRVPTITNWVARGRISHPWWTALTVLLAVACLFVHFWRAQPK